MEAKSTHKNTFRLTENGQQIGNIVYESFFFLKAEINLPNAERYQIAPVGFFGTSISVTKNGTQIASLVMNWKGQIVIKFDDENEYAIKLNGVFSNQYIIENKDHTQLAKLESKFNWRDFDYKYDITYNIENLKNHEGPLLLLLGVYSANFFIATMSGANAGMM